VHHTEAYSHRWQDHSHSLEPQRLLCMGASPTRRTIQALDLIIQAMPMDSGLCSVLLPDHRCIKTLFSPSLSLPGTRWTCKLSVGPVQHSSTNRISNFSEPRRTALAPTDRWTTQVYVTTSTVVVGLRTPRPTPSYSTNPHSLNTTYDFAGRQLRHSQPRTLVSLSKGLAPDH